MLMMGRSKPDPDPYDPEQLLSIQQVARLMQYSEQTMLVATRGWVWLVSVGVRWVLASTGLRKDRTPESLVVRALWGRLVLVPEVGLEPTRVLPHWILNPLQRLRKGLSASSLRMQRIVSYRLAYRNGFKTGPSW